MKQNRTYTCPETTVLSSKLRNTILTTSNPSADATLGGGGQGGSITEQPGGSQKGEAPKRPLTF